jgi:hypothetical protein
MKLRDAFLVAMAAGVIGFNNPVASASTCYSCVLFTNSCGQNCGCTPNVINPGFWACVPGQNCGDDCSLCNDFTCYS